MTIMTYNYINFDYLDTMTGGDEDMKQEMLGMLIAEIPDEVAKMQTATAAADWHEVFQISHKFKTTLSFIGNPELISLTKTIEYCARHHVDLTELPPMVEQIAKLSKPVMAELQQSL